MQAMRIFDWGIFDWGIVGWAYGLLRRVGSRSAVVNDSDLLAFGDRLDGPDDGVDMFLEGIHPRWVNVADDPPRSQSEGCCWFVR